MTLYIISKDSKDAEKAASEGFGYGQYKQATKHLKYLIDTSGEFKPEILKYKIFEVSIKSREI
jgi:hypothetical protein